MKFQSLFGMGDYKRFEARFPKDPFGQLYFALMDLGIFLYGDNWLAPRIGGGGMLDFTHSEERVPLVLDRVPDNYYLWFPVTAYNISRLEATYEYWMKQGWFTRARWFIFLQDEPRAHDLDYANQQYFELKAKYPALIFLVTDHLLPLLPYRAGMLEGDFIIPMAHTHAGEQKIYPPDDLRDAYEAKMFGMYIAGSYSDIRDLHPAHALPFEPDWYRKIMPEAPDIPHFENNPHLMKAYWRDQAKALGKDEMLLLFWDILQHIDPTDVPGKFGHFKVRPNMVAFAAEQEIKER